MCFVFTAQQLCLEQTEEQLVVSMSSDSSLLHRLVKAHYVCMYNIRDS